MLLLRTVAIVLLAAALGRGEITIDASFEGGSAVVHGIDQDSATLRVSPGENPGRGWPCWWFFKASGLTPGSVVTIQLTNEGPGGGRGVWAMPQRATWSGDGETWRHLDQPGEREGKAIIYKQKVESEAAWFAWGPPFVVSDGAALVKRLDKACGDAAAFELCISRDGHSVPALKVRGGDLPDDQRFGVWVQARQHAWESGASWVGRGFIEWLVSDDEQAKWLRDHAVVYFVPVMDTDNVFRGAGGKEQKPQDHNRDWSDAPHWPEVQAAQRHIAEMDAAGRFHLFVDLHNPGPSNLEPFFYLPPAEQQRDNAPRYERFLAASKHHIDGPMKLSKDQRTSGADYDKNWQKISKNWVADHTKGPVVTVTLETSWNTPHSDTNGYMTVGRQLGEAMGKYFREW